MGFDLDSLANYELHEIIAIGASSEVYRATCKRGRIRGREVALKMTPLDKTGYTLTKLEASVAYHKRLHHPTIVTLYSAFISPDERPALCEVLELCPHDAHRAGRDESALRRVLESVSGALLYLARDSMKHGAVSPENVLANDAGRVKLGNVRAAKRTEDEEYSQDIFDLGVLAVWFLTGRKTCDLTPAFHSHTVSAHCSDLITRMTQKTESQISLEEVMRHPFFGETKAIPRETTRLRFVTFSPNIEEQRAEQPHKTRPRSILGDVTNVKHGRAPTASIGKEKTRRQASIPTAQSGAVHLPSPPTTSGGRLSLQRVEDEESPVDVYQKPRDRNVASDDCQIPTAFSTRSLAPQVYKTGQGSLTVQPSHALLVDIRENARRNKKKGNEVLLISPDGDEIKVFDAPHLSVPCVLSEPKNIYRLHELPCQYWKGYAFAAEFVHSIKRRTPQAMFIVGSAQCSLMSNEPLGDVEIKFHESSEGDTVGLPIFSQNKKTTYRVYVSRAKSTVEMSSFPDRTTPKSIRRTYALRRELNEVMGLGRDDEAELDEEEAKRMITAMKCVRLCESFEGIGFQKGDTYTKATEDDRREGSSRMSISIEPRPRW